MRKQQTLEEACLAFGVGKLRDLLTKEEFVFEPGNEGSSSGGPFATVFFRRGKLEIGLVVRDGDQLGCPNYSEGHGYAGHDGLFWALNREGESILVPGEYLTYVAKDGDDPFEALYQDLAKVIIPELRKSREAFSRAIARAHKRFQDRLKGKAG